MKARIHSVDPYCANALEIPLEPMARLAWQEKFSDWPAMKRFGIRLDLAHPVAVRIALDELHPWHLGGSGDASKGGGQAVNGGVIAGIFDAALGVAGALQLLGRRAGTVDLSIKMFRPVTGPASAYGWAVRRSGSLVFVEAMLIDQQGNRCAQASGMVCAAESAGPPTRRSAPQMVSELVAAW